MDQTEENSIELQNEIFGNDLKALWVFAYGSLCWKPGFEFNKAIAGHVKGYKRRFWQGNTTHRGTEEKVCIIFIFLCIDNVFVNYFESLSTFHNLNLLLSG